jgi:hypothetical protein
MESNNLGGNAFDAGYTKMPHVASEKSVSAQLWRARPLVAQTYENAAKACVI